MSPSDAPPPPPPDPGQPWYQPQPTGAYGGWSGRVPPVVGGAFYSPALVILLMIATCGIWGFFWTYRTSEDLKGYNRDGMGGVLGLVIYFLLSVVLMFTIPHEIEQMYRRDGRQSPVSAIWGLWFLLPLIGNIVWYLQVQRALNDFWLSKGAQPG
jgi:Domain of unknown function (DUF4234)